MRKFNPYKNIFYYYRSPVVNSFFLYDDQIENNTTKALINFLLYSNNEFLFSFLKHININSNYISNPLFDLQVSISTSIFDAEIRIGNVSIYIESKIFAPLDLNQIQKHLTNIGNNYLLVITPKYAHYNILLKFKDKRLRFVTWQNIYSFYSIFSNIDVNKNFLLNQFLEYLELINMSEFNGFTLRDFESFLYIDQDPKRESRQRVKSKFKNYLLALQSSLNDSFFKHFEVDVGNFKAEFIGVWGVLCLPPLKDKVHKPHFTFALNSNDFKIFVQIEGKTPAKKMLRKIEINPKEFLNICKKLEGYFFHIKERKELAIRKYKSTKLNTILLGDKISMIDIDYIIKKSENIPLVEFSCRKIFARDDPKINNANFLKESKKVIDQLKPFYQFVSI